MWSRVAVVITLMLTLVLHAGSARADEREAIVAPTFAQRNAAPVSARAAACPAGYPVALSVYAETPNEFPYLDQIDACTNFQHSHLWLRNRSDMVWLPRTSGGGAQVYGLSTSALTFAAFVQHPHAALVPGAAVVVAAPPETVSWVFDVGMSAAWEAREYLYQWAVTTGLAASFNYRFTRVGSAVATCLLAVKAAVDLKRTQIANGWVETSSYISQVLSTGVGMTKCGQGLRQVAVDYRVRVPTYVDDLTAWDIRRLEQVDTLLARMLRAQRWYRYVLLLFT